MTRYARVENGIIKEPYVTLTHIRNRRHSTAVYTPVIEGKKPEIDRFHQLQESLTVEGNQVLASYKAVPKTVDQILQELHDSRKDANSPSDATPDIIITTVDPETVSMVLSLVKVAIGEKLSEFARTREYDDIVSLCTYATSNIPKFQQEGQRGVDLRDQTFVAMYGYLEQMMTGEKFVPKNLQEVFTYLPELTW